MIQSSLDVACVLGRREHYQSNEVSVVCGTNDRDDNFIHGLEGKGDEKTSTVKT
jgi:hypothetical protein